MSRPKIVPELYVSNFRCSLEFYVEVLGFAIRYDRPEQWFAYLERDGAELMIEQTSAPERSFIDGALEFPFGRGVHLQIETEDAGAIYDRIRTEGGRIFLALEDRWYRVGDREEGNRQFIVSDPDGYLLRFWKDLGIRPL